MKLVPGTPVRVDRKNKASRKIKAPLAYLIRTSDMGGTRPLSTSDRDNFSMEETIRGSKGLHFAYLTQEMISFVIDFRYEELLLMTTLNESYEHLNSATTVAEYLPRVAAARNKADCDVLCRTECELDLTPMIYETVVKAEGHEFVRTTNFAEPWRCPKAGRKNLMPGEIAGIVVGCVLFVALVAVVAALLALRSRRAKRQNAQPSPVK